MHPLTLGSPISAQWLLEAWPFLNPAQRLAYLDTLPRTEKEDVFLCLPTKGQREFYLHAPVNERRSWIRLLPPKEAADLIQQLPEGMRRKALNRLDLKTGSEVAALLKYAEDCAGGVMNPRFARLRPEMTIDEAIGYLRAQSCEQAETLYYAYVLDIDQRIIGVISFRELLTANSAARVEDLMKRDLVTVPENREATQISQILSQRRLRAVPVVDGQGHIKGVVAADDLVGLVQESATKEIQRIGGTEALDAPYIQIPFSTMLRKRAGWLTILFLGELFTATAMGFFQREIERAVVLALFIPLIISSGGNAGSQASTLIVRALALGEVKLSDWWRIMRREIGTGLALGALLGTIGLVRIVIWPAHASIYGAHYFLVAVTVALSLVGVVLWGSLSGSMLPLILQRSGFDPASASAPFVATLVDVTGLIIYFSVASLVLSGTLL